MGFTTEEKIAKMKSKGWIFEEFVDSNQVQKIRAKFYEPIGRKGKRKDVLLYNFIFPDWEKLVYELYYGSVGTQRELAKEFGVTPEEISYIKNGRTQKRYSKEGETLDKEVNVGKRIERRDREDIRFHLMQIQDRPYTAFLRKDYALSKTFIPKWEDKIKRLCHLLTLRTGEHYYAEFIKFTDVNDEAYNGDECIVYVDTIYPILRASSCEYPMVFSYLDAIMRLTNANASESQREALGFIINI